jgi:hypothetical protein
MTVTFWTVGSGSVKKFPNFFTTYTVTVLGMGYVYISGYWEFENN